MFVMWQSSFYIIIGLPIRREMSAYKGMDETEQASIYQLPFLLILYVFSRCTVDHGRPITVRCFSKVYQEPLLSSPIVISLYIDPLCIGGCQVYACCGCMQKMDHNLYYIDVGL